VEGNESVVAFYSTLELTPMRKADILAKMSIVLSIDFAQVQFARNAAGSDKVVLIAEQMDPVAAILASNLSERARILDAGAGILRNTKHRMALTELLGIRFAESSAAAERCQIYDEFRNLERRAPVPHEHRIDDQIFRSNCWRLELSAPNKMYEKTISNFCLRPTNLAKTTVTHAPCRT
jgi:hypothetical protein